jgi:hypothetical protein
MKKVLIAGILIIIGFLVVLSFIPLGIEPLTEVYFENHTLLRANSFPNTDYNFSFTVHNLEYQDMRYEYNINVYSETDWFLGEIDSGELFLGNNMSKTIPGSYNLAKGFDRARIQINITKDDLGIVPDYKKKLWWPDPNYPTEIDIHFWTDEIVGPTITFTDD